MGELSRAARFRHWLGGYAFRLTCWLYELPRARTFLEVAEKGERDGEQNDG